MKLLTMASESTVVAMRDWVKDCIWGDVEDASDVDLLSDSQIVRGVGRHYDGGVKQFVNDCSPIGGGK